LGGQVTLCDPIWQVTGGSTNSYTRPLTFFERFTYWHKARQQRWDDTWQWNGRKNRHGLVGNTGHRKNVIRRNFCGFIRGQRVCGSKTFINTKHYLTDASTTETETERTSSLQVNIPHWCLYNRNRNWKYIIVTGKLILPAKY